MVKIGEVWLRTKIKRPIIWSKGISFKVVISLWYNAEDWKCLLELMLRIRNVSECRGASFSILCSDWAVNYAETKFCLVIRLSVDIFCYLKLVKIFCLLLRNGLCSWILCTLGLFGSKLGHKFTVLFKIWLLCEGMA